MSTVTCISTKRLHEEGRQPIEILNLEPDQIRHELGIAPDEPVLHFGIKGLPPYLTALIEQHVVKQLQEGSTPMSAHLFAREDEHMYRLILESRKVPDLLVDPDQYLAHAA